MCGFQRTGTPSAKRIEIVHLPEAELSGLRMSAGQPAMNTTVKETKSHAVQLLRTAAAGRQGAAVARSLGISRQHLSQILDGKTTPSDELADRILSVLGKVGVIQ